MEAEIVVRFIVDINGNVFDPYVENGTGTILEEESIRVIKNYAKFTLGHLADGRIVPVRMSMPISFKLDPR